MGESSAHAGRVAAVVVAIVRGDRVLAMRRAPHKSTGAGRWEMVAGGIEPAEEPLEAARREAREETGLSVDVDPRPVDAYIAQYDATRELCAVVYAARAPEGAEPMRSYEHDAHAWLTPDEIEARGSWPRLVEAARRAIAAVG